MVKLEGGAGPGGDRRVPRAPRHRGLRAPRAQAAVGAQDRRLPGAGTRGSGGRPHDEARRDGAAGRGRRRRAARVHSRRSSARRSPRSCTCRSSASARVPTPTARSSCSTTCSTSRRGASRASCRTSWTGPTARSRRIEALRAGGEVARLPGAGALLLRWTRAPTLDRCRRSRASRNCASMVARLARWRGESIAFVPTMGNLHAGHVSLIGGARTCTADASSRASSSTRCSSGRTRTSRRYPRTPDDDASAARRARGATLLFLPTVDEMYPNGARPAHASSTCRACPTSSAARSARGISRASPRSSRSCCALVQPDVAIFGEKDYQQLTVIRRMVEDLCLPVQIVGAPTVRAERWPRDELAQPVSRRAAAQGWRRLSTGSSQQAVEALQLRGARFRAASKAGARRARCRGFPHRLLQRARRAHARAGAARHAALRGADGVAPRQGATHRQPSVRRVQAEPTGLRAACSASAQATCSRTRARFVAPRDCQRGSVRRGRRRISQRHRDVAQPAFIADAPDGRAFGACEKLLLRSRRTAR